MSLVKLISPQLLAFLAIVKSKTVHAAAGQLHLTQTAITQRIRALERRLATSLFVRSRRGMLLTKEGEALLRYCQQVQALEGEALSYIVGTGTEKNVFINMTGPTTIMHSRIIPQCVKVMKQFPHLLLQFEIDDSEKCVETLRKGDAQLAVIKQNYLSEEMRYKTLQPQHYILVASAKWKKRKLQDILQHERIIDFDPQDEMTFDYLKHFDLFALANKDRHFVNRTDILANLIISQLGYGVLPLEFATPYLQQKKLFALNQEKTYPYLLLLAWFPRYQEPKYFSDLIKACI